MQHGQISYSKVRALTRVATPETEEQLLAFGQMGAASHVERLVRCWRRVDRIEAAARDEKRRESRYLSMFFDEDGMLSIQGRLEPDVGAVLKRAVEAAVDRMYAESREQPQPADQPKDVTPYGELAADAVGLIAQSALNADLDPGSRGDRYMVVLHVDAPVLQEVVADAPNRQGMATLEDGVDASAEASRRIACDSSRLTMSEDHEGNVLDVGRRTRTISARMRRALTARDRTCRFPGCAARVCEAHHVQHWADGGATKLANLLLLCRRHHRAVHEDGYKVEMDPDGTATFLHPEGREMRQAPVPPVMADVTMTVLDSEVAAAGARIYPDSLAAKTTCRGVNYGLAIEVMRPSRDDDHDDGDASDPSEAGDRSSEGHREQHSDNGSEGHPEQHSDSGEDTGDTIPRKREAETEPGWSETGADNADTPSWSAIPRSRYEDGGSEDWRAAWGSTGDAREALPRKRYEPTAEELARNEQERKETIREIRRGTIRDMIAGGARAELTPEGDLIRWLR